MTCYTCGVDKPDSTSLKLDVMAQWINTNWVPHQPTNNHLTVYTASACIHKTVLNRFSRKRPLPGGYTFGGVDALADPPFVQVTTTLFDASLSYVSGAYCYHFNGADGQGIEVLVLASFVDEHACRSNCLACVPATFLEPWTEFVNECRRLLHALQPSREVVIIGGHSAGFAPTVDWDDVVLPPQLKADLLNDVRSFFDRGIDVYQRLKLKPFRKLLLAGVPGTGKTMLCAALAKWAIGRQYPVIYVSSADRQGATFNKIEEALYVAARSKLPVLILLEELDAYLHKEEKALVLNVLDGAEAINNTYGTLLIATTNYPEAIDERVLKRPGRLDRVYIIPEVRDSNAAETMLRQYIGTLWCDEHRAVARQLVGFPGAFVREVAIYALTQVAYDDLSSLPLALLEDSLLRLREQISARDDFLKQRMDELPQPIS